MVKVKELLNTEESFHIHLSTCNVYHLGKTVVLLVSLDVILWCYESLRTILIHVTLKQAVTLDLFVQK